MSEAFGEVLRDLRTKAGLSQTELSRRINVDHSFVSRLESGDREPSPLTARSLAYALDYEEGSRQWDRLLLAAFGVPPIAFSCPVLSDLDAAHRTATPERKAWLERFARLALEGMAA
jgi:transcriptional regulator with XRE-family HTH domain